VLGRISGQRRTLSDHPGGHASNDGKGRHRTSHHSAGRHNTPLAERDAFENGGARADPDMVLDLDGSHPSRKRGGVGIVVHGVEFDGMRHMHVVADGDWRRSIENTPGGDDRSVANGDVLDVVAVKEHSELDVGVSPDPDFHDAAVPPQAK